MAAMKRASATVAVLVLLVAGIIAVESAKNPLVVDLKVKKIGSAAGSCAGIAKGATFKGTFRITDKFIKHGDGIAAVGIVSGVVKKAGRVINVSIPNVIYPISDIKTPGAKTQGRSLLATCPVLDLILGPLSLDVLGLKIDLNKVVLDITAKSGAGKLVGNLVCAVANLLNGGLLGGLLGGVLDQVLELLNQILGNLLPSLG